MASSLSSGGGYLFEGVRSIWVEIAQHLVVNFVVFRREVELQSSYPAVLIPSPQRAYSKTCFLEDDGSLFLSFVLSLVSPAQGGLALSPPDRTSLCETALPGHLSSGRVEKHRLAHSYL